jgi:hypothetical protein
MLGFGEDTFKIVIYGFIHVGVIKSLLELVGQTLIGLIHAAVIMGVLIMIVNVQVIVLFDTSYIA